MESAVFSDIHGAELRLERRSYSDTCRELTVVRPKLTLRSVTTCSCAVWLSAYGLFLYSGHSAVLSAAILVTVLGLLLYLHLVKIDEESVLLLGSLGLQRSVRYASGRESAAFLEMCRVQDVIITEVFYAYRVHYNLCVLLREPDQVLPLFQGPQPRLDCLTEIYRSCQEVLGHRRDPPVTSHT